MTTLNPKNIRWEIVNTLRNADIFSTTVRGVTTATDSFTASVGQTTRTLTNATGVRNIRSLTIASVSKTYLRDYTVAWSAGIVTFGSALSGGEAVVIQYDYGTSDRIFPDMPRDDLHLTSFPRVGMEIVNITTEPFALGGAEHISDLLVSIHCWMPVNRDSAIASGLGGTDDLSTVMNSIRSAIRTNAKSFVTFPYVFPSNLNTIIKGTNNKIIQQTQDVMCKFIVE